MLVFIIILFKIFARTFYLSIEEEYTCKRFPRYALYFSQESFVIRTDYYLLWNLLYINTNLQKSWPFIYETTYIFCLLITYSLFLAVYAFNPSRETPCHEEDNLCDSDINILGATFAPTESYNVRAPYWLHKSIIYYIDSNQVCFYLTLLV